MIKSPYKQEGSVKPTPKKVRVSAQPSTKEEIQNLLWNMETLLGITVLQGMEGLMGMMAL